MRERKVSPVDHRRAGPRRAGECDGRARSRGRAHDRSGKGEDHGRGSDGARGTAQMTAQTFEISSLQDLDGIAAVVSLPVGRRVGRPQEKKEWFVILRFLNRAIPADMFELPIAIRQGRPPEEPDFVVTRGGTNDVIGLIEITEATNEADQREMTAFERSGKSAAMLGEFGGRFPRGASRPGLVRASDIIDAIKRKSGKAIFRSTPTARHLIIYPNSNASILQFDEGAEGEAIRNLREAIASEAASLAQTTNGCLVHVLGKYLVCIDVVG